MTLTDEIGNEFAKHGNATIAAQQKAYMKNKFEFFGIPTPKRRELYKPFLQKSNLPAKAELRAIIKDLWSRPERDYQYFGQELVFKYASQLEEHDIELFEFMITQKSWWDTIDFIAANIVGVYMKTFPQKRVVTIDRWMLSGNMWLQRTCLLFQLKYKDKLDTLLLKRIIEQLLGSKEFFINKAIGWILREYSKTNAEWVKDFVAKTSLSNLSKKEALRLI